MGFLFPDSAGAADAGATAFRRKSGHHGEDVMPAIVYFIHTC